MILLYLAVCRSRVRVSGSWPKQGDSRADTKISEHSDFGVKVQLFGYALTARHTLIQILKLKERVWLLVGTCGKTLFDSRQ